MHDVPGTHTLLCYWCSGVGQDRDCEQHPYDVRTGPIYIDCPSRFCITAKVTDARKFCLFLCVCLCSQHSHTDLWSTSKSTVLTAKVTDARKFLSVFVCLCVCLCSQHSHTDLWSTSTLTVLTAKVTDARKLLSVLVSVFLAILIYGLHLH